MAAHGLQKISTQLGGGGPQATGEQFERMGLVPGKPMALVTGIAETAGGTMMAGGLATPLACSMVSGVMIGAIAKVHAKNGFWVHERGFEYNLHILAATFAVAGAGGGPLTLDGLRGKKHRGLGWAVLQLAVGAASAAGVLALSERLEASGAGTPVPSAFPGETSSEDALDLAGDAPDAEREPSVVA